MTSLIPCQSTVPTRHPSSKSDHALVCFAPDPINGLSHRKDQRQTLLHRRRHQGQAARLLFPNPRRFLHRLRAMSVSTSGTTTKKKKGRFLHHLLHQKRTIKIDLNHLHLPHRLKRKMVTHMVSTTKLNQRMEHQPMTFKFISLKSRLRPLRRTPLIPHRRVLHRCAAMRALAIVRAIRTHHTTHTVPMARIGTRINACNILGHASVRILNESSSTMRQAILTQQLPFLIIIMRLRVQPVYHPHIRLHVNTADALLPHLPVSPRPCRCSHHHAVCMAQALARHMALAPRMDPDLDLG